MKIIGWTTTGNVDISSCEQSNVNVTLWTTITPLPTVMHYLAMVTLNGKAYIIGGIDSSGTALTSVYMYDGVSIWTLKTGGGVMPAGRYAHAALALDTDRALVCGGKVQAGTALASCIIYTASTNTWSTTPPAMAQTRFAFNLVMSQSMRH